MRGGLIIVGIVFWISVRFELPEQMVFGSQCEVSQSRRYLNGEFTSVFAGLLNRGDGIKATFSILKQKPFHYFTTEYDTTRLSGFNDDSFMSLSHVDFSMTFPERGVNNKENIRYKLNEGHDLNERFLMEVHDGDLNYIGAAQIVEAQLDLDPETERIVQVSNQYSHTYFFYDGLGYEWNFVDVISIGSWYDPLTPDLSLEGFAGLSHVGHGTGFGCVDKEYFSIEGGRLISKFVINSALYVGIAGDLANRVSINTESQTFLVNSSEVFVEHQLKIYFESIQEDSAEIIHRSSITYSLVKDSSGQFHPNKSIPGFNTGYKTESEDSIYFMPEVYACAILSKKKVKSNSMLSQILGDFEYDPKACWFR